MGEALITRRGGGRVKSGTVSLTETLTTGGRISIPEIAGCKNVVLIAEKIPTEDTVGEPDAVYLYSNGDGTAFCSSVLVQSPGSGGGISVQHDYNLEHDPSTGAFMAIEDIVVNFNGTFNYWCW